MYGSAVRRSILIQMCEQCVTRTGTHGTGDDHRVDSVIESSLREIILNKNFELINLGLNFCETKIYDNKVYLENLVAVH